MADETTFKAFVVFDGLYPCWMEDRAFPVQKILDSPLALSIQSKRLFARDVHTTDEVSPNLIQLSHVLFYALRALVSKSCSLS